MTEKKTQRLSLLILGDLAISAAATLLFYLVAVFASMHIVDSYIYNLNIELSDIEFDYYISRIYSVGLLVAAVFFVVLFLILLGKRLSSDCPQLSPWLLPHLPCTCAASIISVNP